MTFDNTFSIRMEGYDMTNWIIPVVLKIIVGSGLYPYATKKIVGLSDRPKRFLIMYICSVLMSFVYVMLANHFIMPRIVWVVVGIGFINSLGNYFFWRAMDQSLSKTSLYTCWGDILVMLLSLVVLGEGDLLNAGVSIGIILSVLSAVLFALEGVRKNSPGGVRIAFYLNVLFASSTFGLAAFMMRLWVTESVPLNDFLVSWYLGCVPGAALVFFWTRWAGKKSGLPPRNALTVRDLFWLNVVSFSIVSSLVLLYWAYATSQLIVQPILMLGGIVLPAIIGLFVYAEHRKLDLIESLLFLLGLAGASIIVLFR